MNSRQAKITVMLHDPIPGMLKIHHDDAIVQCELEINGILTVRNVIEELAKQYGPHSKSLFNFWGTSLAPFTVYMNQYKPANLDDRVKNGDRISLHLAAVTGG